MGLAIALSARGLAQTSGLAQAPGLLPGDYLGALGAQQLALHVSTDTAGKLSCTLDIVNRNEMAIPCGEIALQPGGFSIPIPLLQGGYRGDAAADGKSLTGVWERNGKQTAMVFKRDEFVAAERPSPVDGEWAGELKAEGAPMKAYLHVKSDRSGKEYATLDVPAGLVFGLKGEATALHGGVFSFDISLVGGHYGGRLSADGQTLTGVWEQNGGFTPMLFARVEMAAKPSAVDGIWLGVLQTKDGPLRVGLQVTSDRSGKESVTMASPDQHAREIETVDVKAEGQKLRFRAPSLAGSYVGELSEDGRKLAGTWSQGEPLPLNLERAPAGSAWGGPVLADAPRPAMTLNELKAELDAELKPMVENPALAGMPGVGIAVGLYAQGQREVLTYGAARPDSLFEIGGVTATMTGLALARMAEAGEVTLDEPVRLLLPAGTAAKPDGPEMTLLSLATYHSGLQHALEGIADRDAANPFANLTAEDFYRFLARNGVALPANAPFDHSDAGAALLGAVLARRAQTSFSALLKSEVLDPFGMGHTFVTVPAEERAKELIGRDLGLRPVPEWEFGAMAPAEGVRSDVRDMLTYMAAQVDPPAGLAAAMAEEHALRAVTDDGKEHLFRIGLTWVYEPDPQNYFALGMTGGFTSFVFFNQAQKVAGVVLFNRSGSRWAENLGYRIEGLMEGRRAFPLVR